MALQHLGINSDYPDLLELLRIRSFGAPAGNIRLLERLGLKVSYSVSDMKGLEHLLREGTPVIVFLRTGDLPYWEYSTDHAVVVVGYDPEAQQIILNDPYAEEGAISVPLGDFELAWSERDYHYAAITR